jgi:hypothetical protein
MSTKYAKFPLDGGIANAALTELIEAPMMTDSLNLRSPRKLGVPSRVFDIDMSVFDSAGSIDLAAASISGRNVYVNESSLALDPKILGPGGARNAATGLTTGATLQNAWTPVAVTDVVDGVIGQVKADDFSVCHLDNGLTVVVAYVANAPFFVVTVVDALNNTVMPQKRVEAWLVGGGTPFYKTDNKSPSTTLPIRVLAHAGGIASIWYSAWHGPTDAKHDLNVLTLDTSNFTLAAPHVIFASDDGPGQWMQWSVCTHPEAGSKAWIACPSAVDNDTLVVHAFDVISHTILATKEEAGKLDPSKGLLDIASTRVRGTTTDWVTVAYRWRVTGGIYTFTLNGSTLAYVRYDAEAVKFAGTHPSLYFNDGVIVTHANDGNWWAPQPVVMYWDSTRRLGQNGTMVAVRSVNTDDFDVTHLAGLIPYGRAAEVKDGNIVAPLVPFVRCYLDSATDPTPHTVTSLSGSISESFYVQDPSLDVKIFRAWDRTNHRYVGTTVLRAGVDELMTRYGHPLDCMSVQGKSGVLAFARDDQADITYFGDGLKMLRFEVEPEEYVRSVPLANGALITGGQPAYWDGKELVEAGFPHVPVLDVRPYLTDILGPGSGPQFQTGSYSFVAYEQWRDANGELHRSGVSAPVTVELSQPCTIEVFVGKPDTVRSAQGTSVLQTEANLQLYVTDRNGSVYYQSPLDLQLVTNGVTRKFNASSSSIEYPPIYTTGGEIAPSAPPALWDACEVGGRLFGIDATNRSRLFYTKPKQYGIAYEWATFENQLQVDASAGRLIAVRELGGYPMIMAEHGIYTLNGDGPDAFGNGGFSSPIRISSYNCSSDCRRMAITTPKGLFLKGADGFYAVMPSSPQPGSPQPIYSFKAGSKAVSSAWVSATEELLVFNVDETLTIDLNSDVRIGRVLWSNAPNPRKFVSTRFEGAQHDGGWLVTDDKIFKVPDAFDPDRTNPWLVETGWMTPNTSFGELTFGEFVLDCIVVDPSSSIQVDIFYNYDDSTPAATHTKGPGYIASANAKTPGRARLRFPAATALTEGTMVAAKVRVTCPSPTQRDGETILPIQIAAVYTDDNEKVPTLSRNLAGNIEDE